MQVQPITGEPGRFYVHSETEDDAEHVVDMTCNNGNGECSCRYFEVTCGPNFRHNGGKFVPYYRDEKGKVNKNTTQCKHIRAVRDYLLDKLLPDMFKCEHRRAKPVTIHKSLDGFPFA